MAYLIVDADDWGHDHDCREELEKLKKINWNFKITLFTVPAKTTIDMLYWAKQNEEWVELAQHGWNHHDNWECEHWTYEECLDYMYRSVLLGATGFKAPGWQISTACYEACKTMGYWVADQPYNTERRPEGLKVYEVGEDSLHLHTWDCNCNNGIYEAWDMIVEKVKNADEFLFVSEAVKRQEV